MRTKKQDKMLKIYLLERIRLTDDNYYGLSLENLVKND